MPPTHELKPKLANLAFPTTVLLSHALALSPSQNPVVGDAQVQNVSLPTKAPTFDVSRVIAKAKSLDPANGAAIEQAYNAPARIGIVEFRDAYNYGIHDYNTIGLNPDYSVLVMAIALLHEWEHVKGCGGGPSNGGKANHPTDPDCKNCQHVTITAKSYVLLFGELCDTPCASMSAQQLKKTCEALGEFKDAASRQNAACQASACSPKPDWNSLANWTATCPCCPP